MCVPVCLGVDISEEGQSLAWLVVQPTDTKILLNRGWQSVPLWPTLRSTSVFQREYFHFLCAHRQPKIHLLACRSVVLSVGVMFSTKSGCRSYDQDLLPLVSIARHKLLRRYKTYIERKGHCVISLSTKHRPLNVILTVAAMYFSCP